MQLVASTFLTKRKWPSWKGLRNELGVRSPAAAEVFHSLPRIGQMLGVYGAEYGYVRTNEHVAGLVGLPDEVKVAVTVAGWWRTGNQAIVEQFVAVLQSAVRKWRESQPDITESVQVTFTGEDVPDPGDDGTALARADLYEALQREPPFWRGHNGDADSWSFYLDDSIERYASVVTIEDYLAAVSDFAEDRSRTAQALLPMSQPSTRLAPTQTSRWWIRVLKWAGAVVALGVAEWARDDVIKILQWMQHHLPGL